MVAYPLLRVESKEVEVESLRGLPPGLLRPASIEPLDLDIDGDLSALWTAKAADLAQLAPQLPIGALQQRGRTNDFACHSLHPRIAQRGCGRANPDVMSESHAEPDVELVRENRNRGMESKKGRGWEEL